VTIPVPLSIRLQTSTRDLHITSEVDALQFGSTSPGGFDSATLTLHRPLALMPGEVTQFGRLYVYDARNGNTVWEGRLQDPGRSAGSDGQTYALAAVGGQAHLQDDTRQLYYVDTDMTRWDKVDNATAAAQVEQVGDYNDTGVSVMILRIPQGTSVDGAGAPSSSRVVAAHRGIAEANQKIARLSYNYDCGLTTANITHSMYAATQGVGTADVPFSTTFSTTSSAVTRVIGTDWTAGRNRPIVRFHYTAAASNVSADTWWLLVSGVNLLATRYDKSGNELLTGASYTSDMVLAHQVVEDLLGRILGATVDGPNATVATTSYLIEQLCYPDGVNPATVLEDLIKFEAAYTYHLWESNPANGKFRFEWVPWPTSVRYEADIVDGFSSPSSGNTVYNKIAVRYRNRGTTRIRLSSQSVPALAAAGFDRVAFLDLGDEASGSTNAGRVGDQYMAEHRYPVNQGSLTVRTPILDMDTGRMVQPWEIRPGNLIRVHGVAPYPDALNSNGRDGNTIFKIAAASYSSADVSATLDLDSYSPSVARALASLVRRPVVRRR
jgi:hypothetical protein